MLPLEQVNHRVRLTELVLDPSFQYFADAFLPTACFLLPCWLAFPLPVISSLCGSGSCIALLCGGVLSTKKEHYD